jgi:hypothetical protein
VSLEDPHDLCLDIGQGDRVSDAATHGAGPLCPIGGGVRPLVYEITDARASVRQRTYGCAAFADTARLIGGVTDAVDDVT